MLPDDAVRQIQCAINASLDQSGASTAEMYRPTVRRVADDGTGADVTAFASRLCADIAAGSRPDPVAANRYATRILQSRNAVTDGGSR